MLFTCDSLALLCCSWSVFCPGYFVSVRLRHLSDHPRALLWCCGSHGSCYGLAPQHRNLDVQCDRGIVVHTSSVLGRCDSAAFFPPCHTPGTPTALHHATKLPPRYARWHAYRHAGADGMPAACLHYHTYHHPHARLHAPHALHHYTPHFSERHNCALLLPLPTHTMWTLKRRKREKCGRTTVLVRCCYFLSLFLVGQLVGFCVLRVVRIIFDLRHLIGTVAPNGYISSLPASTAYGSSPFTLPHTMRHHYLRFRVCPAGSVRGPHLPHTIHAITLPAPPRLSYLYPPFYGTIAHRFVCDTLASRSYFAAICRCRLGYAVSAFRTLLHVTRRIYEVDDVDEGGNSLHGHSIA